MENQRSAILRELAQNITNNSGKSVASSTGSDHGTVGTDETLFSHDSNESDFDFSYIQASTGILDEFFATTQRERASAAGSPPSKPVRKWRIPNDLSIITKRKSASSSASTSTTATSSSSSSSSNSQQLPQLPNMARAFFSPKAETFRPASPTEMPQAVDFFRIASPTPKQQAENQSQRSASPTGSNHTSLIDDNDNDTTTSLGSQSHSKIREELARLRKKARARSSSAPIPTITATSAESSTRRVTVGSVQLIQAAQAPRHAAIMRNTFAYANSSPPSSPPSSPFMEIPSVQIAAVEIPAVDAVDEEENITLNSNKSHLSIIGSESEYDNTQNSLESDDAIPHDEEASCRVISNPFGMSTITERSETILAEKNLEIEEAKRELQTISIQMKERETQFEKLLEQTAELQKANSELAKKNLEMEEAKRELQIVSIQIEERDTQVRELLEQTAKLQKANSELAEKNFEIEAVKRELQMVTIQIEERDTQVRELLEQTADLQKVNSELAQNNLEMEKAKNFEIEEAKKELQKAFSELEENNLEMEEAKRELEIVMIKIEERDTQIHKLFEQTAELVATNSKFAARHSKIEAKNTELEEANNELQMVMSTNERRALQIVNELQRKVAELEEQKSLDPAGKNSEMEARILEIEAKNTELESAKQELQMVMSTKERRALQIVNELQRKVAELEEQKSLDSAGENLEMESRILEIEAKYKELEGANQKLVTKVSRRDRTIVQMKAEMEATALLFEESMNEVDTLKATMGLDIMISVR